MGRLFNSVIGDQGKHKGMNMGDGGKGSVPRPFSVSNADYAARWDMIFGKDQKENKPAQEPIIESEKKKESVSS